MKIERIWARRRLTLLPSLLFVNGGMNGFNIWHHFLGNPPQTPVIYIIISFVGFLIQLAATINYLKFQWNNFRPNYWLTRYITGSAFAEMIRIREIAEKNHISIVTKWDSTNYAYAEEHVLKIGFLDKDDLIRLKLLI